MVTTQRRSQPRLGQRGESCGVYKRTGKVPRQRTKVLPCCNFGFPLPHSSSPCIFTNTFLSLLFYKIYLIKDVDTTFRLTVGYYLFLLNLTQGPNTRRLSFYPFFILSYSTLNLLQNTFLYRIRIFLTEVILV